MTVPGRTWCLAAGVATFAMSCSSPVFEEAERDQGVVASSSSLDECPRSAFLVLKEGALSSPERSLLLAKLEAAGVTSYVELDDGMYVVRGDMVLLRREAGALGAAVVADTLLRPSVETVVQTQPEGIYDWPLGGLDDESSSQGSGKFSYPPPDAEHITHVFVLDTGVFAQHSEIAGRVEPPTTEPADAHGTAMASLIGGKRVGVAKLARIHDSPVLGAGGDGCATTVAEAIQKVRNSKEPRRVINLSMEGKLSKPLNDEIEAAVDDGIVVVAAAGNSSRDVKDVSPASAAGALTVSGVSSDSITSGIGYGVGVDLYAPFGASDAAGVKKNDVAAMISLQGTSVSAAYVSGVAAALWSACPDLQAAEVSSAIVKYARAQQKVGPGKTSDSPNARVLYTKVLFETPCDQLKATSPR